MGEAVDVAVVGAGAAGLMTAIWSARAGRRVVALDGARTLGAKILVAGGGRCNVTHDVVDESAYAGSTGPAIRKVLRRFDAARTIEFFRSLGVELKREPTGKMFPTTDDAHTVLDALLGAAREAGAELRHPCRVERVERDVDAFAIVGSSGTLRARRVVLATGGMSLPKTGSDGGGYALARSLGHSITERVFPALVPLVLPDGHPLRTLSGVTFDAEVRLVSASGKALRRFVDSTLCTHFGLSGPSVLDVSRYYTDERSRDAGARLELSFLPGVQPDEVDRSLIDAPAQAVSSWLRERVPERLARVLIDHATIDGAVSVRQLGRDARRRLVRALTAFEIRPTGDRGWNHAEVTAGGVPLNELVLETMESRRCPRLHIVGELCDVDGRIGGYNFQWAWASGYVAGCACAES
ncbi:MAG: NAD(P)/FAD-dependent oxidoreductase [Phycisphaerales bacterium]